MAVCQNCDKSYGTNFTSCPYCVPEIPDAIGNVDARDAEDLVNSILKDRGSKYNPTPGRRYKELEIWMHMVKAVAPLMPKMDYTTRGAIEALLLKTARAIESGLGGVYHHDTSVDFEGYSKVLVGTVLGIPPEDVTE